MTAQQLKPDNPLVPFIIFFAFVILLTIMITNMRSGSQQQDSSRNPTQNAGLSLSKQSSPLAENTSKNEVKTPDTSVPDIGRLLAGASNDLDLGNMGSAEDKLRTALVFDPYNPRILSLLGFIMMQSGRNKDAELFFRIQTSASPNDVVAYNNLATALARQGKLLEATGCIERVLQITPDSGTALLSLASLYAQQGNTQDALDNLKRAYAKLGERMIPLTNSPSFDKIRSAPEFQALFEKAALDASAKPGPLSNAEAQKP